MKMQRSITIGWCAVLSTLLLVSCHEYQPPVSHLGHGAYHCYFQDGRDGRFYKGVSDTENDAMRLAKKACVYGLTNAHDLDHVHCQFSECIFR